VKRLSQHIRDEKTVSGGRRLTLEFGPEGAAERIPAILSLPATASRDDRAPGVLLLHGYSSHKEQMAGSIGRVLLRHGIASLAIDLPLHGERRGGMDMAAMRNPIALASAWRAAQADARLALGYLGARPEIDVGCLAIVGYSMGSFLGVLIAADEPKVRALVLAAGGDLPTGTPFERLVRTLADPLRAIRRYAGRPLHMVHGRRDRTVTAEQAERLFAAAGEPKTLRWWEAGHFLPDAAIDDAAEWLRAMMRRA
jgi:fermentation-respiration switch protein FrsA (DUF1100 family)